MKQEIDQLLKDVTFKMGTLREARNRFSPQLAPEFRIFNYLRTDEMGVSRCIADLLDSNGAHGQGRVFLDIFLKEIGSASAWATTAEDCQVMTEKQANGQRRIDIYLDFQRVGVIGIENKPWAGDQDRQLADYAAYIKKEAGNKKWLLVYLSNRDPSEESITTSEREVLEESKQFVRLTYENIIEWLEDCACKSKALVVRVFIEELAKFIRMDINGELDMSEEKEVSSVILKTSESLSSAFQVFKAMEGVKKELLNKFHGELDINLERHGLKLDDWDLESWRAYIGFSIRFCEHKQNLNLRFAFDQTSLNQFFWGISRDNKQYNNQHVWAEVNKLMSTHFGSTKSTANWPWYSYLPDHEFGIEMKNWWISPKPWVSIMDGSLVEKITDIAVRVHKAFSDATPNQLHLLLEGDSVISTTHPDPITP